MITISVASGKGGAGKTSIASALASMMGSACVFADCDVDAANGAIALGAAIKERELYHAGPEFRIDPDRCTGCSLCASSCRFGAIRREGKPLQYKIVSELCERCGACFELCPAKAIVEYEKTAGELYVSTTRSGIALVHAELVPGEDTSGKLVRKVRDRAEAIAEADSVIIVDAPPGIGCPVIASISGSDLAVIVVEASSSGVRDAERLVKLVAPMRKRAVAIINKAGLNPAMDALARAMIKDSGVPLAGEIPFNTALRSAEESGETWMSVNSVAGQSVASTLRAVKGVIDSLSARYRISRVEQEGT
jgi:MinD superfamily P-loop ATPase